MLTVVWNRGGRAGRGGGRGARGGEITAINAEIYANSKDQKHTNNAAQTNTEQCSLEVIQCAVYACVRTSGKQGILDTVIVWLRVIRLFPRK